MTIRARFARQQVARWLLPVALSILGCAHAVAPWPGESEALSQPSTTTPSDSAAGGKHTARDFLDEADEMLARREYEEAAATYGRAAEAAERENDRTTEVEALAQVARVRSIQNEGEQGRPWLERARALASPDDPRGWSRYELVKGVYEREDGDRPAAVATFSALYDYCMARGLADRAVDAAHHAAIVAEPEVQIEWARKGIRAAEASGNEKWLGPLWNNLGWTYDDLGRYPESLDALLKAKQYHDKTGDDLAKLVALWSVGHAYRMTADRTKARVALTEALAWAERRYGQTASAEDAGWVGSCLRELGELAVDEGERARGAALLVRARDKLVESGMKDWDATGLEKLEARIDELEK